MTVSTPQARGPEWWVGRLNNKFAAPSNMGQYSQWYHTDNKLKLADWLGQSNGVFTVKKAGLVTVDMYQVRVASKQGPPPGVSLACSPAAQNQCADGSVCSWRRDHRVVPRVVTVCPRRRRTTS